MKSAASQREFCDTSPRIGCCAATEVAGRELLANAAASNFALTVVATRQLQFPYGNLLILLRVTPRPLVCS